MLLAAGHFIANAAGPSQAKNEPIALNPMPRHCAYNLRKPLQGKCKARPCAALDRIRLMRVTLLVDGSKANSFCLRVVSLRLGL